MNRKSSVIEEAEVKGADRKPKVSLPEPPDKSKDEEVTSIQQRIETTYMATKPKAPPYTWQMYGGLPPPPPPPVLALEVPRGPEAFPKPPMRRAPWPPPRYPWWEVEEYYNTWW